MKEKLIKILQKNQFLYGILRKSKILTSLVFVHFLALFDIVRKDSCNKDGIRCEYDIKNIYYKYTLSGKDTPTCCLTHLYEILRDIAGILNDENIDYFIMYGTLLGQVRHSQTFIPWDTDVDIVVMTKDKDRVVEILKKRFSTKYNLVENQNVLKINYSNTNHLHADIYFWDESNNELIDSINDGWIQNRIKEEDVFPLTMSKLYDIDVKVPKNSEKVLKDTYGKNCLEKAYKKYAFKRETLDNFTSGKINKDIL